MTLSLSRSLWETSDDKCHMACFVLTFRCGFLLTLVFWWFKTTSFSFVGRMLSPLWSLVSTSQWMFFRSSLPNNNWVSYSYSVLLVNSLGNPSCTDRQLLQGHCWSLSIATSSILEELNNVFHFCRMFVNAFAFYFWVDLSLWAFPDWWAAIIDPSKWLLISFHLDTVTYGRTGWLLPRQKKIVHFIFALVKMTL